MSIIARLWYRWCQRQGIRLSARPADRAIHTHSGDGRLAGRWPGIQRSHLPQGQRGAGELQARPPQARRPGISRRADRASIGRSRLSRRGRHSHHGGGRADVRSVGRRAEAFIPTDRLRGVDLLSRGDPAETGLDAQAQGIDGIIGPLHRSRYRPNRVEQGPTIGVGDLRLK
jgi:hypothetical protein